MEFPHVAVNRETFLREALTRYCAKGQIEKAVAQTPKEVLEREQIKSN